MRITVVDLQGHELATLRRSDVVEAVAGPLGHFAICTGHRVDFLSGDLKLTGSAAMSPLDQYGFCFPARMHSPSRKAIAVYDRASQTPRITRYRLYDGTSSDPIAEISISKGQRVAAFADDGFLICEEAKKRCNRTGQHDPLPSFPMPEPRTRIAGLIAPDRLLMTDYDGRQLYAESPAGEDISMGDIAKIRPPFIDSTETQMSAASPRRILYRTDGCLLGDFDDCYGVVFRRFAVFDSQTSRMLFRHGYAPGADLKISPNGKMVLEHDGPEIHLFLIP
jgi:hypothetical protein